MAVRLAAAYDGHEEVPADRAGMAKQALEELIRFRKKHQGTFFSNLHHVTSFWERPNLNVDSLMEIDSGD